MNESSEAEEVFGQVNSDEERLLFQQPDEKEREDTIRRRVKPGKRVKRKKNEEPKDETPINELKNETPRDWYHLYQENTLPQISFDFGIQWNDDKEDNVVVSLTFLFFSYKFFFMFLLLYQRFA